jgi:hypothetical protein
VKAGSNCDCKCLNGSETMNCVRKAGLEGIQLKRVCCFSRVMMVSKNIGATSLKYSNSESAPYLEKQPFVNSLLLPELHELFQQ